MTDRLIHATFRAEQRHFWWAGFRAFVRPLLAEATCGVARPMLLDVGCGTGANLRLLSEFGTAYGFDVSTLGLRYATEHYGQTRVARASGAAFPFGDEQFDVVTAFDVLYALSDHDEGRAIHEMFRVLRPGGAAIVNVAALRILRGHHAVFGYELRRSSRRRLRALLTHAGFRIERLTYTNALLFPLTLALRTAQRMTRSVIVEDIAVPPAPVNATLATVQRLEALALRRVNMPIGSSLLCLARKPG